MQINSYSQKIFFICFALSVAVIGLSVALYNQGPRVRFVRGVDTVQSQALTANSSLSIVFDRPIEQRDYSSIVSISPAADFTLQTNTQSMILTLESNLKSGTNYTISLSPEIYDSAGKKMKNTYKYSFDTAQSTYVYLERNNSSSK